MPNLRRSPPSSQKASSTFALPIPPKEIIVTQESDTASDLMQSDIEHGNSNISRRPKRKHGDIATAELRELLYTIQQKQEADFLSIKKDMGTIKEQNVETQKSLEFLSSMYDTLLQKFETISKENDSHRNRIITLESKVEQLERSLKSSSIEIRNIPSAKSETKQDLQTHILHLGQAVNQPISDGEIRDIFRVKTKKEPGPVIVEFTTNLQKENLMKSVAHFNKEKTRKEDKINTTHLKIQGKCTPIFVADNLTSRTRRLFYLAREFTKSHHQSSCWTAFGKVFMRLKDGQPSNRIDCEDDLTKITLQK